MNFTFENKDIRLIEKSLIALALAQPELREDIEELIEYIHKQERELN